MGAQRVKANFNALENAASQRDKDRDNMAANIEAEQLQLQEDEEKQM